MTEQATATVATSSKKLAGGAKNYLDDLIALNKKTTQEMERGVRENYLDAEGAKELAQTLRVSEPRVKQRYYFYFTQTQTYSIPVEAYDREQAMPEAERMHRINVSQQDIHFGSQSRFNSENGPIRRVYSELTTERPTVEALPTAHAWELERSAADRDPNDTRRVDRHWRTNETSWNTLITE